MWSASNAPSTRRVPSTLSRSNKTSTPQRSYAKAKAVASLVGKKTYENMVEITEENFEKHDPYAPTDEDYIEEDEKDPSTFILRRKRDIVKPLYPNKVAIPDGHQEEITARNTDRRYDAYKAEHEELIMDRYRPIYEKKLGETKEEGKDYARGIREIEKLKRKEDNLLAIDERRMYFMVPDMMEVMQKYDFEKAEKEAKLEKDLREGKASALGIGLTKEEEEERNKKKHPLEFLREIREERRVDGSEDRETYKYETPPKIILADPSKVHEPHITVEYSGEDLEFGEPDPYGDLPDIADEDAVDDPAGKIEGQDQILPFVLSGKADKLAKLPQGIEDETDHYDDFDETIPGPEYGYEDPADLKKLTGPEPADGEEYIEDAEELLDMEEEAGADLVAKLRGKLENPKEDEEI